MELTLIACDLLAWTQSALLDSTLATAEPRLLPYKLLHARRASPAANDVCSSASTPAGPGNTPSPPRSPGFRPCRCPPREQQTPPTTRDQEPGVTDQRVGAPAWPAPYRPPRKMINAGTAHQQQVADRPGAIG